MNFNYQKAYCVSATPAFNNLNETQKTAFNELHTIVGDRNQDRALNIPTCEKTDSILKSLSCLEISDLSRASYFVGHWQPSYLDRLFDNKRGESWKISNVCDQELRKRLLPCRSLQIHEGKLRVTFSSKDCWLWEEFGLATEENIKTFEECGLPFGESKLNNSTKKLSILCGDLWPDVESLPPNEFYVTYLEKQKAAAIENENKKHAKKISDLKQSVKNAEKELNAFTWLINAGICTDNCIYYNHIDTFSFGWRSSISDNEQGIINKKMVNFPYKWEFKSN